jgi:branched-chain amino acid transport system substrate-binding protein
MTSWALSPLRAGLAGLGLLASVSLASAADPVTIGAHIPLTGASSELGQGFDYGARLAFAEINAHGGVNGHELKLVEADDQSTPNGAITAVQRLTLGTQIALLWNGSSSSPTVPVASIATDMVDFIASNLKAHSIALLSCDQANCKASVPLLKTGLDGKGIKIVEDQTFHSGDTDFTGQISAIKAANPDVVQIWGLPADGGRIVAQIRLAGITAPIVGDTVMTDQAVLELAGKAAEGMYAMWIAGAQFLSDDTGPMKDFRAHFTKAYPNAPTGMPNQYAIRAYADAYVIAEAVRRAGADPTPAAIVTQLDTIHDFVGGKDAYFTYAAAIGLPRGFSPTDHQGTKKLTVVVVRNGKFETAATD